LQANLYVLILTSTTLHVAKKRAHAKLLFRQNTQL
jgi:hypothetical protein